MVLNFHDVSTFKRLKQEEKKSELMTTLYSSVHHEMLGPLKNALAASVRLIRSLNDQNHREIAQIIMICTKQVLLHANDLLDQKFIENGKFETAYTSGSIYLAIAEIAHILTLTLADRDINVVLDMNKTRALYPVMCFDKRRL